jgi:hypothetical protein
MTLTTIGVRLELNYLSPAFRDLASDGNAGKWRHVALAMHLDAGHILCG